MKKNKEAGDARRYFLLSNQLDLRNKSDSELVGNDHDNSDTQLRGDCVCVSV